MKPERRGGFLLGATATKRSLGETAPPARTIVRDCFVTAARLLAMTRKGHAECWLVLVPRANAREGLAPADQSLSAGSNAISPESRPGPSIARPGTYRRYRRRWRGSPARRRSLPRPRRSRGRASSCLLSIISAKAEGIVGCYGCHLSSERRLGQRDGRNLPCRAAGHE